MFILADMIALPLPEFKPRVSKFIQCSLGSSGSDAPNFLSSVPMRYSLVRLYVRYIIQVKCISLCAHVSFRHFCTIL